MVVLCRMMPRWEYQVIRLNIEPPTSPPSPPAPAPAGSGSAEGPQAGSGNAPGAKAGAAESPGSTDQPGQRGPVFSEAYLKEEFPRFYGQQNAPQAAPPPQDDAGQQLQAFLNAQGQNGWDLVGLQHAGPHTFIIFKRLVAADVEAADAQNQQLRLTLEMANRALAILEKQAL